MIKYNTIDMVFHIPSNHNLLPNGTGSLSSTQQPNTTYYQFPTLLNTVASGHSIHTDNNKRYFALDGTRQAIRSTSTVYYENGNNIQFECDFILRSTERNVLYCVGSSSGTNETTSVFEVCVYQNSIVVELGSKMFESNYTFEANKEYHILVTATKDGLLININGEKVSNFDKNISSTAFLSIPTGNYHHFIGNNNGSGSASNPPIGLDGYITNIFTSFNGMMIQREHKDYTNNDYNKILNFKLELDGSDSESKHVSKFDIVNVYDRPFSYVYDGVTFAVGQALSVNVIGVEYCVKFGIDVKKSHVDALIFNNGEYEIRLSGGFVNPNPEPKVVVNENTTSALDFENDIIDQVGTTVWGKSGTADVTSTNKIFGENSFETKALGDSLYTNSNIINGGATPFTIEFYALIKPQESKLYTEGLFITDNRTLSIDKTTRNLMYSVGNYLGKIKIKYNELNKIMITFDGSATRVFVNDILDIVVGTNNGIASTIYSFLSKVDIGDDQWDEVVTLLHFDGDLTDDTGITWSSNNNPAYDNGVFNNAIKLQSSSKQCVYSSNGIADFSSSDFTVEFFINFQSFNAGACVLTGGWNYSAGKRTWGFLLGEGHDYNKMHFYCSSNGSISYICSIITSSLSVNTTYHVAAVREGSTFRLFLNGMLVGTSTSNASIYADLSSGVTIGSYSQSEMNSSYYVDAWFDELRITKGVARYTENFTPPTEPFPSNAFFTKGIIDNINIHDGIATKVRDPDPYEEYLVVDLAFDGENNSTKIVDNAWNNNPNYIEKYEKAVVWERKGNNAIISTIQPFDGFSSLYLDSYSWLETNLENNNVNVFNFSGTNDFTFSLDLIMKTSDRCSLFKPNWDGSAPAGIEIYIYQNKIYCSGWMYVDGQYKTAYLAGVNTIAINTKYNISLVRKDMVLSLYVNGQLDSTINQLNEFVFDPSINYRIGADQSRDNDKYGVTNRLNGYIKNFKIYKGVAVIPENPTGKIQLDFDNNLVDKYGNSTWTNNGVTFDQVNSVKGHAAYFNGSDNTYLSTIEDELNFSNNNFVISADFKPIYTEKLYYFFLSTNHTAYSSANTVQFAFGGTQYGCFISKEGVIEILTYVKPVNNQYYSIEFNRNNNIFNMIMNDVLIGQQPTDSTKLLNFNSNGTRLGSIGWGSGYNHQGYIDNFKSIKDSIETDFAVYPTYTYNLKRFDKRTISLVAHDNNSVVAIFKNMPKVYNFILEFDYVYLSDEQTGITFMGANITPTIGINSFGYILYMQDGIAGFGYGGSNYNAIGSTKSHGMVIGSTYKIKIVSDNSNFKIYISDILLFDITDSRDTTPYHIGVRTYVTNAYDINTTNRISNLIVKTLSGDIIYEYLYNDLINTVIDKPAVHLPLETNAINTGIAPLTVNSNGSPTYTTVEGKKCIKFESGKYLTINSNNIFNLGTNSDFYIEFDFYPVKNRNGILSNKSGWVAGSTYILHDTTIGFNYWNGSNNFQLKSTNALTLNTWSNVIFRRKDGVLSVVVNDSTPNTMTFEYPLNFNLGNNGTTIGTYAQDSGSGQNVNTGYMSNFKMFVGTSEIPETYNDKKVLDLDFKPTGKSYLFKDNNNKCVIHPVNITQRDYQDSQYCCSFNGTNQYLQLGKNDLLNFGNDDFVIYLKFYLDSYDITYQSIFASGGTTGTRSYITILGDGETNTLYRRKIRVGATGGLFLGTSTNDVIIGLNECYIIRKDNVCTIILNGITSIGVSDTLQYNLNFNNNTTIGRNEWDGANGYFKGSIYSIKVLRNTTDLTLLEDEISLVQSDLTYKLINTTDQTEQQITIDSTTSNIQIERDSSSVTLSVDDQTISLPTTTQPESNEIVLFGEYTDGIQNEITIYDKKPLTESTYIIPELDYTPLPYEVVDGEETITKFQVVDAGEHTIDGFTEGHPNAEYRIINKYSGMTLLHGRDSYYHYGINPLYIQNYVVELPELGITYPLEDHAMKRGYITYNMSPNDLCVGSDYVLRLIRRHDGRIVGEYEFVDYVCVVENLDCDVKYDAILFDRNDMFESITMSNRTPRPSE